MRYNVGLVRIHTQKCTFADYHLQLGQNIKTIYCAEWCTKRRQKTIFRIFKLQKKFLIKVIKKNVSYFKNLATTYAMTYETVKPQ